MRGMEGFVDLDGKSEARTWYLLHATRKSRYLIRLRYRRKLKHTNIRRLDEHDQQRHLLVHLW